MDEARSEIRRLQDQLESLERSRRSYLAQLRMVAERQLSDIVAAEQGQLTDIAPTDGASASSAWMGSLVKG